MYKFRLLSSNINELKNFSMKDYFNDMKSRARSAKDTYNYYKLSDNLKPEYESNMRFIDSSKSLLESGELDNALKTANLDDSARLEELKKLKRVSSKIQKDSEFMMKHPKLTAMKRAINEFKDN